MRSLDLSSYRFADASDDIPGFKHGKVAVVHLLIWYLTDLLCSITQPIADSWR